METAEQKEAEDRKELEALKVTFPYFSGLLLPCHRTRKISAAEGHEEKKKKQLLWRYYGCGRAKLKKEQKSPFLAYLSPFFFSRTDFFPSY